MDYESRLLSGTGMQSIEIKVLNSEFNPFILHAFDIIQCNIIMTLIKYNTLYGTYIHNNIKLYYITSGLPLHDKFKSSILITNANSDTIFVSVLVRVWVHDSF